VPPRRDSLGATSPRHFRVVVTTNLPAPLGLVWFPFTHGLRRGLHSYAASRGSCVHRRG
jgi:hypothetical protein